MTTIVPGEDATGDNAQQLARLLYELLGGVAGSRYVPVARLGEEGNAVLQRATILGLAGYASLRDLIEKLREAIAAAPVPPISASTRPATSLPPEPTIPLPQSESKAPQHPPNPPPPAHPPVSVPAVPHEMSSSRRTSRMGMALRVLVAVVGLIAVFGGIKTFYSGVSNRRGATRNEVPPPAQNADTSPPAPAETAAAPIQFTIFDDLGAGQISESVSVFVDDQTEPAGAITLTPQQAHGAAVINLPSAGRHAFRVKTESVVIDLDKGSKKIISSGRWENDFRGGEKYDLSATPREDGDTYQLRVAPRN
jgi:hypothetical protein